MDYMKSDQAPNAALIDDIMEEVVAKYGDTPLTRSSFRELEKFVADRVIEESLAGNFRTRTLMPNNRWANYSHMRIIVHDEEHIEAVPVWVYDDEEEDGDE